MAEVRQILKDSLVNFVTQLGGDKDKSEYSYFTKRPLSEQDLSAIHRFGGIGGKIVDAIAEDMGRKWRKVSASDYDFTDFYALEEALHVSKCFVDAERWGGLYGGAAIVIDIEGDKTEDPLDLATVGTSKPLTALRVLTRYDFDSVGADQKTGRMPYYRESTMRVTYHPSRVLVFDGIPTPVKEMVRNGGWAGSRIERCYDSIVTEASTAKAIKALIQEARTKLFGVSNLAGYLDNGERQETFTQRFAVSAFLESILNVTLYDKDEEEVGERTSAQALTALAPLLEKTANRLAGESDVPMTRLYGSLASGLNTSAGTNQKDYHEMIAARQGFNWSPHLKIVDELLLRSVSGAVPPGYYSEWKPLAEQTEKEEADTEKVKAETAKVYHDMSVIVPAIIAEQLATNGPYDIPKDMLEYMRRRDGLDGKPLDMPPEVAETPEGAAALGKSPTGGSVEVQKQALNGAQISSLIEIATKVRTGEISQESGIAIVLASVPSMSPDEAKRIVGEYDPSTKPEPVPQQLQNIEPPRGSSAVRPEDI